MQLDRWDGARRDRVSQRLLLPDANVLSGSHPRLKVHFHYWYKPYRELR